MKHANKWLVVIQLVLVVGALVLVIGPDGNVLSHEEHRDAVVVGIALLFCAAMAEVWKRLDMELWELGCALWNLITGKKEEDETDPPTTPTPSRADARLGLNTKPKSPHEKEAP